MISDVTASRFPLLTPFQQGVTYYARTFTGGLATDTYTAFVLPQARSRELTSRDYAMSPDLVGAVALVFELWKPVLDAVGVPAPRKDDYLIDATGTGWTVRSVDGKFHQNNYHLYCIKKV